jgi:hypothetical protein
VTVEMLRTAAFRKARFPFRPALCVVFDNHLVRCVSWAGNRSLATSSLLLVEWRSWLVILLRLSIAIASLFSVRALQRFKRSPVKPAFPIICSARLTGTESHFCTALLKVVFYAGSPLLVLELLWPESCADLSSEVAHKHLTAKLTTASSSSSILTKRLKSFLLGLVVSTRSSDKLRTKT